MLSESELSLQLSLSARLRSCKRCHMTDAAALVVVTLVVPSGTDSFACGAAGAVAFAAELLDKGCSSTAADAVAANATFADIPAVDAVACDSATSVAVTADPEGRGRPTSAADVGAAGRSFRRII